METAIEELRDRFSPPSFLVCPVCLELQNEPKLLPCSHTICNRCMTNLQPMSLNIPCPVCRKAMTKKVAESLPTNRALEEAVDDWKSNTNKAKISHFKDKICQCKLHGGQVADQWCLQCKKNVCIDCCKEQQAGTSQDNNNQVHAKTPVQDFDTYCQRQAELLNDYVATYPHMMEILSWSKQTSRCQSGLLDCYLDFIKKVGDIQHQLQDVITNKFDEIITTAKQKFDEINNMQRSGRADGMTHLVQYNQSFQDIAQPNSDITVQTLQHAGKQLREACHSESLSQLTKHEEELKNFMHRSLGSISRFKHDMDYTKICPIMTLGPQSRRNPLAAPQRRNRSRSPVNRRAPRTPSPVNRHRHRTPPPINRQRYPAQQGQSQQDMAPPPPPYRRHHSAGPHHGDQYSRVHNHNNQRNHHSANQSYTQRAHPYNNAGTGTYNRVPPPWQQGASNHLQQPSSMSSSNRNDFIPPMIGGAGPVMPSPLVGIPGMNRPDRPATPQQPYQAAQALPNNQPSNQDFHFLMQALSHLESASNQHSASQAIPLPLSAPQTPTNNHMVINSWTPRQNFTSWTPPGSGVRFQWHPSVVSNNNGPARPYGHPSAIPRPSNQHSASTENNNQATSSSVDRQQQNVGYDGVDRGSQHGQSSTHNSNNNSSQSIAAMPPLASASSSVESLTSNADTVELSTQSDMEWDPLQTGSGYVSDHLLPHTHIQFEDITRSIDELYSNLSDLHQDLVGLHHASSRIPPAEDRANIDMLGGWSDGRLEHLWGLDTDSDENDTPAPGSPVLWSVTRL